MTWHYDPAMLSDPDQGPLMQVRFRIGDTLERNQHINDEEITYLLSAHGGSVGSASAAAAHHIAMQYSHQASYSSGSWREELNTRATHFAKMAETLGAKSSKRFRPTVLARYTREEDRLSGRL